MKRYKPFLEQNDIPIEINKFVMDYLRHKDASKLIQSLIDSLEKSGNREASKKLQKLITEV